jgi:hypothetical protein
MECNCVPEEKHRGARLRSPVLVLLFSEETPNSEESPRSMIRTCGTSCSIMSLCHAEETQIKLVNIVL